MTKILVQPAPPEAMDTVANLMQLYSHDLSEYQEAPLDDRGLFRLGPCFDTYWEEPGRDPFLILVDTELAGFAFIRELAEQSYSVAEFFIASRFRCSGVGKVAVRGLFDKFRGNWQVAELEKNLPAQRFWRAVIDDYTGGEFTEQWSDVDPKGPMQVFTNIGGN